MSNSELDNYLKSFLSFIDEKDFFAYHEVFNFLYLSGCRFNEIVNKKDWELSNNQELHFDTLKGGGRRKVLLGNEFDLIKLSAQRKDNYHLIANYSHYLRFFKMNCAISNSTIQRKPVGLHLFRHNRMKQMHDEGKTYNQIKEYFALNSLSVVMNYVHSEIVLN